jgi:hypothetical protein
MIADKKTRDILLNIKKDRGVYLEGNLLKLIKAEANDEEFEEYLQECIDRDKAVRVKRLDITKQVQKQNSTLIKNQEEITRINEELKTSLKLTEKAKCEAETAKETALNDLDLLQKKTQTELIGTIVKVALIVIVSVGVVSTGMYGLAIWKSKDTQIIGSAWSNMLSILLTNAFSIIGTIMGVKYATPDKTKNRRSR